MKRQNYPSDLFDDERSFVAPYLTLMEEAPQREHSQREVFNGLRWLVRTGAQWHMMPQDLPLWAVVSQQTQRWLKAGIFEAIVHYLRAVFGWLKDASAAIFDSRALQSSPESGHRAGYDGAKRRKGCKVHLAVDTLGHLLVLHVTPTSEQDRAQVWQLASVVQEATGDHVGLAFADQGYIGDTPAQAAQEQGMYLEVIKLPRCWVVERSFARMICFRWLSRDDECLPETLAGLHLLAFAVLRVHRFSLLMAHSP